MAEPAVLLRGRGGQYNCYASRWGGTDDAIATVDNGTQPTSLEGIDWQSVGSVSFPAVVEHLDYLRVDALYREHGDRTTIFLPLWFGLPLPDETGTRTAGALVAVRSLPDARMIRAWFRRLKGVLADTLQDGSLPALAIPLLLRGAVQALSDRERYLSSGRAVETVPRHGGPASP